MTHFTCTYKNATFAATDANSSKVLRCLFDNMFTYGAEERFVEAVSELIADGIVTGPLAVLEAA